MQTATYGSRAASSFATAKLVLSGSGVRGFYRGFGTTIMREVCIYYESRAASQTVNIDIVTDSVHLASIPAI